MKRCENGWNDRSEYVIDDNRVNGIHLYNSKHNALDEDNSYEQITLPLFSSLFILIYIFFINNDCRFAKMSVNEKAWN